MSADKYSGLVTAIAVLAAVIYADGGYDKWDAFLGFLGLLLGLKYIPETEEKGKFFIFLVASLLSISVVAMAFFIFQHFPSIREMFSLLSSSSFSTFLGGIALWVAVIRFMPKAISNKWLKRDASR